MRAPVAVLLFCSLLAAKTTLAQAGGKAGNLEPLPRDLEIQLALSALPAHLRDHATVYVLNPERGFEVARQGTNGFHTLVARTGDDTFHGTWPLLAYRDDILYPISFDAAGAKAQMRVFFDAAAMQAKGTSPEALKKIMQERFRTGYYPAPERAGVSYMLSPILRTYDSPDQNEHVSTVDVPHVMYYAPNVSSEQIGAATPTPEQLRYLDAHGRWPVTPDPFLILHGRHGYIVQFRGTTERDADAKQYAQMLSRLCEIRKAWCLPE